MHCAAPSFRIKHTNKTQMPSYTAHHKPLFRAPCFPPSFFPFFGVKVGGDFGGILSKIMVYSGTPWRFFSRNSRKKTAKSKKTVYIGFFYMFIFNKLQEHVLLKAKKKRHLLPSGTTAFEGNGDNRDVWKDCSAVFCDTNRRF